jgi:tRNA A37 threonylcarbamoyladenosine dehydratase
MLDRAMADVSDLQPETAVGARDGADPERRFGAVARLYGAHAYARFTAAHAVVVGIGGVGSWAAEALARSGIGRLTLVDLDHIAESNANRQIHALGDSFGRAKVAAMAERIRAINPRAAVREIEDFVTPENVATLLPRADVLLDCIDQVRAKAALLAWCRAQSIWAVSCGAAGGRRDPTRIRTGDLARASGDPLLASVRARLRREHGFPRAAAAGRIPPFGISAVYSDEPVALPDAADCDADAQFVAGLACAGYGSSVTVTAPIGFAAAALALGALAASVR